MNIVPRWDIYGDSQARVLRYPTSGQYSPKIKHIQAVITDGRLGRAMVLGSFQCRGVLLLWHIVEQGYAVLAAGAGRMSYLFIYLFFISSILSSFSNASSVARRLDILKYCGPGCYHPAVVVSYYRRLAR